MKTLAERITEAENAVNAAAEGSPERAAAEARLGALKEAQTFHTTELSAKEGAAATAKEQEIATALGVPVAEAKKIIKAHKDAEQQSRTDLQKKEDELKSKDDEIAAANKRAQEAQERADKTLVDSKVEIALTNAGVDPKRMPKILADPSLTAAKVENGQVTGVDEFVNAAKEEYPEWFGQQTTERRRIPKTPKGDETSEQGSDPTDAYINNTYKWRPETPS